MPFGDMSPFSFRLNTDNLSKSTINGIRIALFIGGLLAIVLGILVLVWPGATLAAVAVLFGIYFLVIGLIRIITGIVATGITPGMRVLNIILGVLVFVAGVFVFRNPASSLLLLGLLIGVAWIMEGIAAIVESADDSSRWYGVLFGVISLVAGIVVLFLPLQTVAVFVIVGGIFLIVAGVAEVIRAFTFGRARRNAQSS